MQAKIKSIQNNILTLEALEPCKLKVGDKCTIEKYKKNRSLDQNAMCWSIIQQISAETGQDAWSIYLEALERTNCVVEWIEAIPEAKQTLQRVYRIVQEKENRISQKGTKTILYKCYMGSSKFNTNEFKILIDWLLDKAFELNIEVNYDN